jgi:ArsR family transcriptional regulator, lead/cadmium/zinc/bismuth-responsive transcriptional repressor
MHRGRLLYRTNGLFILFYRSMDRRIDGATLNRRSMYGGHSPRPPVPLPSRAQVEAAAEMFSALGDPERLRLLLRLAESEACVSELAEDEGEKITTVSARLKTLSVVRLVRRRREAKHVFYALADEHVLPLIPTPSTTWRRAAPRCPRILKTERIRSHDDLLCPDSFRPCSSARAKLRTPRRAPQWPRGLFARWSPPPSARGSCRRACDRGIRREPRHLHFGPSLWWS